MLSKNYFELFALPVGFDVDPERLREAHIDLQKEVHPDKFAAADQRQQRLAVQMAAHVNSAFEVLNSPVARGVYLLSLSGVDADFDSYTHQDMDFLMEQIALREAMDDLRQLAEPEDALDDLIGLVDKLDQDLQIDFAQALDKGCSAKAKNSLAKMHFSQKLTSELKNLEAELLDY